MDLVAGSLSSDLIMQFAFGRSYHFVLCKDFDSNFIRALRDLAAGVHLFINFPWLMKIMKALPEDGLGALNPQVKAVFDFRKVRSLLYCFQY